MKAWFKKVFFGIILCVPFVFSACTLPTYSYSKGEVSPCNIQLIHYDETDVEEQNHRFLFSEPFDDFKEEKCTVLEELTADKFEDFETDMVEVGRCSSNGALTKSPYGYGIRIIYEDGSFLVITWTKYDTYDYGVGFVNEYDADGKSLDGGESLRATAYMWVATNYFEMKIPY